MTTEYRRPGAVSVPTPTGGREAERRFHEEAAFGKAYDGRLLRRMWPFVRPYSTALWISVVLMPVSAELLVAQPRTLERIVDHGILRGNLHAINHGAMVLLALVLAEFAARFAMTYLLQVVGQRSMADLRNHAFGFLQRQRMTFFDRQPIGRLVTRVTNDVDALGELFASGAVTALGDAITLARIVVAMAALSPRLSAYTFAVVPPLTLVVDVLRRRAREAFRSIRAKTARMNAYLNEQVVGVSVVQAYGQERRCQAEFAEINEAYREANLAAIRYDAMLYAIVDAVSSMCIATLLFVAARGVGLRAPATSLGVLMAFVQYIQRFFEPLRELSSKYTIMQSAMAGAERIFGLLDQAEPDAPARTLPSPPRPDLAAPALAFEGVWFGYSPDRPALRGVSFTVGRGRTVALVGATGAGKTTVIALVQRLYELDRGAITMDGVDIRDIDRDTLRGRVVVVPQDVVLFPGDVLANVALGDPSPDLGKAESIARSLGLDRMLSSRGKGLRTPVAERGQNFSAGERQLIALARALYRDPEILVLDEATSSMDSESEAVVQTAISHALQGRTAVVIAHRLSTIRDADEILVFHHGTIAERGNHDALLAAGGIYARLHRLQLAQGAPAPSPTAA